MIRVRHSRDQFPVFNSTFVNRETSFSPISNHALLNVGSPYKYTINHSLAELSVTQTLLVSFLPSSKNKELVPLFHFSAMELNNHNDFFSHQQHSHIHRPNNGGRNDDVAGGSRPQVVHEGNVLNVLGIQHPPPPPHSSVVCGKQFSRNRALCGHLRIHSNHPQRPRSVRRPRTNVMEPQVIRRNIPDLNELPLEADMVMIMEPHQNVRNIPDLNELPDPEDDQI